MPRESRLTELRRKTNRDLIFLLKRELNRGLTLAEVVTTKESPLFDEAERVYQMVERWLPLVSDVKRGERQELESILKELWSALDTINN